MSRSVCAYRLGILGPEAHAGKARMNRPQCVMALGCSGRLVQQTLPGITSARSVTSRGRVGLATAAGVGRHRRQRAAPPLARSRPGSGGGNGSSRWGNENRLSPGGRSDEAKWLPDTETSFLHSVDLSSTPAHHRPPARAPPWQQALATKLGKLQYQYCEHVSGAERVVRRCGTLGPPANAARAPPCAVRPALPLHKTLLPGPGPAVNWRQDTWSDLQLFMILNMLVFAAGAWVEVRTHAVLKRLSASAALQLASSAFWSG